MGNTMRESDEVNALEESTDDFNTLKDRVSVSANFVVCCWIS